VIRQYSVATYVSGGITLRKKKLLEQSIFDAMTDISPELVQALSSLLINAIQASTANIATSSGTETVSSSGLLLVASFKTPTFTEYHSMDETTVAITFSALIGRFS